MLLLHSCDYPKLFLGSSFFSCGGGVSSQKSNALMQTFNNPTTILQELNDFSESDWLCTVYAIGASGQGQKNYDVFLTAINHLEEYLQISIKGVIPGEIGSEINALWLATKKGVALVDADMVGGRAVPEEHMDVYGINNLSSAPAVIVNDQLDTLIVRTSRDMQILEKVYRSFALASGGYCYIASRPIQKHAATQILPSGTVSAAIKVGTILQRACSVRDVVDGLLDTCGSHMLTQGVITDIIPADDPGFCSGTVLIQESLKDKHGTFTLHFKNENIVLFKDGNYVCSVPDLISLVDTESLKPLSNSELQIGSKVVAFGTPPHPIWETAKAISILEPRYFGFNNIQYVPLQKR